MSETIKLVSLRTPLPTVEFPNGRSFQVMEATALTERLRREYVADRENETKLKAVLHDLVPDATDDDWETVTAEDMANIMAIAERKTLAALAIVEASRKNGGGEKGGSPLKKKKKGRPSSPRSSPMTTSPTSARG